MKDALTQKIVELVPEIVELKSGCIISHFLKGTGTILCVEKHEGESDTYCIGYLSLHEPLFEREPWNPNWTILGRPITLADVLRAMYSIQPANKTLITLECDGQFIETFHNGSFSEKMAGPTWNLALNLDGQTDETRAVISKLLGV